ncbi:type VI secretion system ATPase TssH [Grimontia sp. NTOU-MAR1]|uniref:type VI secretion system ATPase TssH n=1 Tax=Grimontia sp. NTOU-MAR1 TaxID=3111011 RepID=UPI002DB55DF0|nr:type VI secretion system ATPase TssH [Grimontia sp. NTOU-MAR1]WRV99785.1 type VI secretion system ATPase TssH [Grimontia sp. NTOU-MAR1]
MIRIELHTLIGKLNQQTKLALEQAGALSIERQNPEVTVEHLLFTLLDNPLCDVRVLLKSAEVDHTHIRQLTGDALSRENVPENTPSFSPLLVELLQDAWLLGSTDLGHSEIRSGVIFLAALIRPDRYLPLNLIRQLESVNRETMKKHFARLTEDSAETAVKSDSAKGKQAVPAEAETALARFCTNFSAMAKQGELDPVLCRDDEINLMIDILCRRRKNNPIVVGDAGVGKSAVVEGLAQRIVDGNVPDSLKGIDLMSLDLGLLQAGASVKGEFEKRLKAIIDEVKTSPVPIILFIDEAHTMIGAGAQEGGGDAANLLKPALARGELRTVAATTWKEYKKYFEKDPALSRRFQLVKLDEPNVEQAVDIMRGLHGVYEKSHQVLISDDALVAAAELSERYVSGRQLPDKAIDVLDTACARIAINLSSPPRRLAELETRTIQRQRQIDMLNRQAELGYDVDEALLASLEADEAKDLEEQASLREAWRVQKDLIADVIEKRQQILAVPSEDEEPLSEEDRKAIRAELRGLYAELETIPHTERLVHPHVDAQQIAEVIGDWTGVPVDQMNTDELSRITHLPELLGNEIKGQDVALEVIHRHLLTARADLRRPGRPKGAFLLAGPSGVGKTETVVQLAELLYGGKQFLTTINMSEYQEKHTVSRLIGSPPGYVGYGEGGILTEAIRKMPYSIVLLDEVEKAHPEVLNLFYQAFDKGELADGEGRVIDCQNVVFFLTSNLGYQTIVDYAEQPQLLEEMLYPELAAFFKPALLARMEIVPYLPLSGDTLNAIIKGKLSRLVKVFAQRYDAETEIDDALVGEIQRRATRSENGARMLEAIIEGQLLPPVSLALLNKLAAREPVKRVYLTAEDGEFVSEVE